MPSSLAAAGMARASGCFEYRSRLATRVSTSFLFKSRRDQFVSQLRFAVTERPGLVKETHGQSGTPQSVRGQRDS